MTGQFLSLIRLQLLLLWRTGTRSTGTVVGRALALLVIVLLAAFAAVGAMSLASAARRHSNPVLPPNLLLLGFSLWYLYAMMAPLLGAASSQFVDVTKLNIYPVSSRTVFLAGLAGQLASPTLWLFLPAAVAGTVVLAPAAAPFLPVLLLLFVAHCVCTSQCLTMAMLLLLTRRRAADLLRIVAPLVGVGMYLVFRLAMQGDGDREFGRLLSTPLPAWLWLLPPGWAAALYSDTVAGGVRAGAALALAGSAFAAYVIGWRLQERAYFSEIAFAAPGARAKRTATGVRQARREAWIERVVPPEFLGALHKETLLLWREPLVKTVLLQQGGIWLVFIVLSRVAPGGAAWGASGYGYLSGACTYLVVYLAMLLLLNLHGLEGRAMQMLLLVPAPRARIVAGKAAAYFLLFLGLLLGGQLVLSALFRSMSELPMSMALGVSLLFLLLGLGAVTSVYLGMPLQTAGKNPLAYGRNQQRGCLFQVGALLALLTLVLVASPMLAAVYWLRASAGAWTLWFTLPATLIYAAVLGFTGLLVGSALLQRREQELFEVFCRAQE